VYRLIYEAESARQHTSVGGCVPAGTLSRLEVVDPEQQIRLLTDNILPP